MLYTKHEQSCGFQHVNTVVWVFRERKMLLNEESKKWKHEVFQITFPRVSQGKSCPIFTVCTLGQQVLSLLGESRWKQAPDGLAPETGSFEWNI